MNESESTAEMLRDAAAAFLKDRASTARLRGWLSRPRPVDRALWQESAKLGWTGLLVPEAMGGLALGMGEAVVLADSAGRQLFAEPLVASAVMPALLLAAAEAGAAPQLAASLAGMLVSGERVLTVAWQEAAGQLDLLVPSCQVVDGMLTGQKVFVPACEPDGIALVWALSAGVPVWVAVDLQAPGVLVTTAPAGLGSHASLIFDRVRLLDGRPLLQRDARNAMSRVLAGGRLALAAELTGLASACLSQTLVHLRARRQFDRSLGSFQAVQHRCVDLHMEIELAKASLQQAVALFDHQEAGGKTHELDAACCAAKARAGEAAVRTGREAVQLHGAMGFCDEVDIGLYVRAALYGNAWLGGPIALRRQFAASSALAGRAPTEVGHA